METEIEKNREGEVTSAFDPHALSGRQVVVISRQIEFSLLGVPRIGSDVL